MSHKDHSKSQKPYYPYPIIAREGWPFIGISAAISIFVTLTCGFTWSILFWLITVFCIQFFRDPPRAIPTRDPQAVLSPADGKIIVVDNNAIDPIRQVPALKISVFMNVFNVHSNRSPVDGTILEQQYFPGQFINASFDKASTENERNALVVELPTGQIVTFIQIAGLVARRILCYTVPFEKIYRGQRYGFIRFGSRVDLYLPVGSMPTVTIGQKVSATTTVLATLAKTST